jgi:hypothetical protein
VLKVLLVVLLFAAVTYALVRVIERRGVARPVRGAQRPQRPQRPPTRPVAPDDDEDFLRDLDRKRRHPEDPDS